MSDGLATTTTRDQINENLKKIDDALTAYYPGNASNGFKIGSFMADLMHYAEANSIDFKECLNDAECFYGWERGK